MSYIHTRIIVTYFSVSLSLSQTLHHNSITNQCTFTAKELGRPTMQLLCCKQS